MKNITLAVEADVLRKARRVAAERETTVNALVRAHLRELAEGDQRREEARRQILRLAARSPLKTGGRRWTREALYDR